METQPTFGPDQIIAYVVSDVAQTVSERSGESQRRQSERYAAATGAMLDFQPRDAVEAMFAGHCVMFHELIVDSVQRTFGPEDPAARRATRSSIVAMDRAFGGNLKGLKEHRASRAEAADPVTARAETNVSDRIRRHQAPPTQPPAGETAPIILRYSPPGPVTASPQVGASRSPVDPAQSMAPVRPGDAWRPAAGIDHRAEATLAPMDRSLPAVFANRQARRHPNR